MNGCRIGLLSLFLCSPFYSWGIALSDVSPDCELPETKPLNSVASSPTPRASSEALATAWKKLRANFDQLETVWQQLKRLESASTKCLNQVTTYLSNLDDQLQRSNRYSSQLASSLDRATEHTETIQNQLATVQRNRWLERIAWAVLVIIAALI